PMMQQARASEERFRCLQPMGPLDGIPVGIKDMFLTRGQQNRKGSTLIAADELAKEDAPAVAALKRSGFVQPGRVTTPEFAWKGVTDSALTGPTNNPWDITKTAGGSSGGSAAMIPLGMGPLSLGTDAGGSVRIPAGFCGIVGHKPTHGLAPMWPPSAFYPLAHVGPMAWTVEDAAMLMDVLVAPDPRDTTAPPPQPNTSYAEALREQTDGVRNLRIAFSPALGYVDIMNDEVAAAVAKAVEVFADMGAIVELKDPGFGDPLDAFNALFYGGAANAMRAIDAEQRKKMDTGLVAAAEWAAQLDIMDYLAAGNERLAIIERMGRFHQNYDLLITPTLPIPAFETNREVPEGWPHDRWPTWTPFSLPFNLTGQPAISVPCGFTREGLPIGLQIVGNRYADALVFKAAHAYQCANPLTDRRPQL
ncbi:MAG: amidase, partial [Phycisphaeraceae bacterium]